MCLIVFISSSDIEDRNALPISVDKLLPELSKIG